jgi:aminocarboxymuconate-semialdehyde decarboxylase
MVIVDVHAHYYPRRYLALINPIDVPPAGLAPLGHQTIADRLALLDRAGIDVQVLSVSQSQPYLPTARDAARAAALVNDLYAELCAEHAGRFYSFAALPLPHIHESHVELARAFEARSVVGITIGCTIAGLNVDDPVLGPVYAELNERSARVLLHPMGRDCLCSDDDYDLGWLVGAICEDTVAAIRLAVSGVADRYPNIRFIVPHLGGCLPFIFARFMAMTSGRGSSALKRMYYDTVAGSASALRCACDVFGPERLMFGTDYPYDDETQFMRRLSILEDVGTLSADELDRIRGARAAELLALEQMDPSPPRLA